MPAASKTEVDAEAAMRLLCRTQTQLMVAENAAMLGRMAAALSHELNTPFGALAGAVQTLRSVVAQVSSGERIEPSQAAELDVYLDRAIRDSMQRVQEIIGRMQRIANLYGATTCAVAIDGLIADIVALLDPKLKLAHVIDFQLQPELVVECHPEQISAVLSALLHHLLEMQEGRSALQVSTSGDGEVVTIAVAAPQLVLADDQLDCLLRPGLQASDCTWNLYSSRQILLAHGGDLRVDSSPALGTLLTLTLPVKPREALSDGGD